jgi:hypothetical protein
MNSNYYEAWDAMNKLQEHSSKLNTIKDLVKTSIQNTNDDTVIALLEATNSMLELYVSEFDELFYDAWDKTMVPMYKDQTENIDTALGDIDEMNDGVLLNRDQKIKQKLQNSWKQFLGN